MNATEMERFADQATSFDECPRCGRLALLSRIDDDTSVCEGCQTDIAEGAA